MGEMPVGKLLFQMSWPAILSMTINALYNVVDSMFVSKVSEDALASVSIITPLQMVIIAFGVGSGVGVNSLIARRLGARRFEEASKAAKTGIIIGLFNYFLFLIIGICVPKAFVSLYAEEGTYIFENACTYLKVVCIGSLFVNIEMIIEKILQSTGNMISPMLCSLTGALVNILFDPILIFGLFGFPKLGVLGAAIATVFGQLCSLIVAFIVLKKGRLSLDISFKGFKLDMKIVKEIYAVGLPAIVMQSIVSVMNIFYNKILIQFGSTAVAVLGVYFKLQSFTFMPVFGLNQGAMPIIGFNYGARNKKRLLKTYRYALLTAIVVMGIGLLIFQLIPDKLLSIFNAGDDMLVMGIPALRIISLNFIPAAFGIINGCVFQGTGHGVYSLIISIVRQLIGILPLAYLFAKIGGVTLSWYSFPCSEVIGLILSFVFFYKLYKKELSKL